MTKSEGIAFLQGGGLGVLGGILIAIFILGFIDAGRSRELGQAICDQEYDMDFKSYKNQELKCKTREIKNETAYDGIIVEVG